MADEIKIYPQVLRNAKVRNENKRKFEEDPDILADIERIEQLLEGEGRILIRPSGTEPLVRVMLEGPELDSITKLAEELANSLSRKFG